MFSKDPEILNNTLKKSLSLLYRVIKEVKKYILYSRIMIVSQSDNIFNYIIRYLGDEENNEILIERRLYSKLEKALK